MIFTKRILEILVFVIVIYSCAQENKEVKWHHVEISPLDNSQVITIITEGNRRYVINGKYKTIPENNYLLLDLSKVDRLGDGLSICWDDNGYKWKIASSYASIIENKLDSTKYWYDQPLGDYGQPTSEGYMENDCGGFLIREDRKPWGNLKVKYIVD